jgi:TetR/AcrR family transcriptional regulator, transcriptional repressor for nem operon
VKSLYEPARKGAGVIARSTSTTVPDGTTISKWRNLKYASIIRLLNNFYNLTVRIVTIFKMAKTSAARDRIIKAAGELFHLRGIKGASIDEVLKRSRTGKSQFTHYFKNKDGLILAVLDQLQTVIRSGQVESTYSIQTWEQFDGWFTRYIEFQDAVDCELSCPLGTIGNDLTGEQKQVRRAVQNFFEWCTGQLARFFAERKAAGELPPGTDPDALADFCLTVMEGGMLLTKIQRDTRIFRPLLCSNPSPAGPRIRSLTDTSRRENNRTAEPFKRNILPNSTIS